MTGLLATPTMTVMLEEPPTAFWVRARYVDVAVSVAYVLFAFKRRLLE